MWITYAKIKQFFLELFFPSFCLGCQKEGTFLCSDCQETLEISEHQYCLCNKNPLRIPFENPDKKCSRCQNKKLSGLYFALSYKEKALTRKIIHQFKYEPYLKKLAPHIAQILARYFVLTKNNTNVIWDNSVLVPVPSEKSRLKYRGYSQTEFLANELGQIINVPTVLKNLVKIKKTKPQAGLSAQEREVNLQNAFKVLYPELLKNKKVFLIDDVYTTGSTMEECAKTLKNTGIKKIFGISIAREE